MANEVETSRASKALGELGNLRMEVAMSISLVELSRTVG